jgi:hypothetical protein
MNPMSTQMSTLKLIPHEPCWLLSGVSRCEGLDHVTVTVLTTVRCVCCRAPAVCIAQVGWPQRLLWWPHGEWQARGHRRQGIHTPCHRRACAGAGRCVNLPTCWNHTLPVGTPPAVCSRPVVCDTAVSNWGVTLVDHWLLRSHLEAHRSFPVNVLMRYRVQSSITITPSGYVLAPKRLW